MCYFEHLVGGVYRTHALNTWLVVSVGLMLVNDERGDQHLQANR